MAIICLDGCGTQNKFASAFGKRRYNKGFYWDSPKSIEIAPAFATKTIAVNKASIPAKEHMVTGVTATKKPSIEPQGDLNKTEIITTRTPTTLVTPEHTGYLQPSVSKTNTLPPNNEDINTGKGFFSLSGFVLSLAGLGLFIFGSGTGMMLLIAILTDVAGIIFSIYAVIIIDKYDGFAMIALALNALILGLTFGVRL